MTDPNIEQLADRIASSGGRQRSKVSRINSTTNEYRLCYCEDPFGNIIEIYTHNYETLYGGMNLARIFSRPVRNAHKVPTFVGASRESIRPGKLLPKQLATGELLTSSKTCEFRLGRPNAQ